MINTSVDYKLRVKAPGRDTRGKVNIYFNGDQNPPVVFSDSQIRVINLLEESQAETASPLGSVSSNEVVLTLDNTGKILNAANAAGAYFGKIKPNVLVEPFYGIMLTNGTYEYVPLGKFRTGDWVENNAAMEVTTICNDKLLTLGQKELPQIPVLFNTTLYHMFEVLFQALGFTSNEYVIDASLTQAIKVGWFPAEKVREVLQQMAVGGCCNITIDRLDRIVVTSLLTHGNSAVTLSDTDMIFDTACPQNYTNMYSSVTLSYKIPSIKDQLILVQLDNISVTDSVFITRLKFNEAPVAAVTQINIIGSDHTIVRNMSWSPWDVSLELYCGVTTEVVTVQVLGKIITTSDAKVGKTDETALSVLGVKDLALTSIFLQDATFALTYATSLIKLVSDPHAYVTVENRGNPELELADAVTINDVTNKILNTQIKPIRINLNYDGALSGTIVGIKTASLG